MSVVSAFCTMCNRSVYLGNETELSCPVCSSPLIPTNLDDRNTKRIAENESLARDVNERIENIESGRPEGGSMIRFVCECGDDNCSEQMALSKDEYEKVRTHPERFITKPRHDIPGVEIVVERHPDWIVVEKEGFSAQVVREKDPRP